jgi:pimeloyl-ACP methyl ester carboxylesterase
VNAAPDRKRLPRGELYLEVDGCVLAAQICGRGEPVLFIQGVGVSGSGWRPQVDALAPHVETITYDNRGLGGSVPNRSSIDVPRLAADAAALLTAANHEAAHVVGHSLGGLIALELALGAPQRVKSLALLCTFAGGKQVAPLTRRMLWLGLRSQVGTRAMRRRGFLEIVMPPGPIAEPERRAREIGELFGHDLAVTPPAARQQLRAMRRADVSARLGELSGIRSLVVSAEHDPIAPPALGRALAAGLRSNYVEIAGASHGLPITHAERVNELLLEHVRP